MHKSSSEAIIGAGSVAGSTVQVRRYMTNRLTNTNITVMAGQAVAVCNAVNKGHIRKVSNYMAITAILIIGIGRYVIRQFTDTNRVVVAGVTTTHERRAGMIKGASAKGTRGVTNTTIFSGRHVVGRFNSCACINTIMTGRAIVHDVGMIE